MTKKDVTVFVHPGRWHLAVQRGHLLRQATYTWLCVTVRIIS